MAEPYSYVIVCIAVALGIGWATRFLIERRVKQWQIRRKSTQSEAVGMADWKESGD